jgi:2-desacetyl-2-hydroxyethyl bacteriochlorophyllide A dehydrogenase
MGTESSAAAAVLTGPSRLVVAAEPVPAPGPGQLLIAPDAVGICATDLELQDGSMPYLTSGVASYPLVPGHEWTGTVVAVGPGVEAFLPGDRVVGECSLGCGACERCAAGDYHICPRRSETGIFGQPGGMQERLLFPAAGAHRVPAAVRAEDAALVEPSAIAYRALARTGAGEGDPLLVVGAGTIGLLAAMIARARGVRVSLAEVDEDRAAFARSLGLEVAAPERTGFPFVVEASGSAGGRRDAVRRCDAGGTVVLVGFVGAIEELDLDDVVVRDLTLRGSLGSPGVWPAVIELLETGALRPSVLVTHRFPLEQAEEAFRLAAAHRPGVRKILVRPNGGAA